MNEERLTTAVFGGAFDPPHREHVRLIKQAIEELGLTRLVVVPSYRAPHKLTATSFADRSAMLRLALADVPEAVVDTIEEEVEGNTYSAVVLPLLEAKYGKFVHLVGGDSLLAIESWYHPEEVLAYPIAVFARDNRAACVKQAARLMERYGASVTVLEAVGHAVSSGDVRLSLAVGRESADLDHCVYRYVVEHRLYAPYPEIVEGVSSRLAPARWAHTQEVALYAASLAPRMNIAVDKALLAGLLHDCAKTADGGEIYAYLCIQVPADCRQPAVVHAFVGSLVARLVYGVEDEDILGAIRYHTTGRADMTPLERLIYLADYAEPTRTHEGAAEVRALAEEDIDAAFVLAVERTYQHIADRADLCPLGEECYRYYVIQQGEQND